MRCSKRMFVGILVLTISFCSLVCAEKNRPTGNFGFVLIAHGSNNQAWNDQIEGFYRNHVVKSTQHPSRLVYLRFGQDTITNAVDDLRDKDNVTHILLVHLSPSSYSERHYGLIKQVSEMNAPDTLRVSPAMDDHPVAVEILRNQAATLLNSNQADKDPKDVSLILVGYGPVGELENILWVRQLERIGEKIRRRVGFRKVACMTFRKHSYDLIRKQAMIDLQRIARRLKKNGRVIVIPYVLSEGSFQKELQSTLSDIVPASDIGQKGVLSNTVMAKDWVMEVVNKQMDQPRPKTINRKWSAMEAEEQMSTGKK